MEATQAYRLELKWCSVRCFIIAGDKCWEVHDVFPRNGPTTSPPENSIDLDKWLALLRPIGKKVVTGAASVYPEFNLLWLEDFPDGPEEMSVKDFEKKFASLPRWEVTRYAVRYGINDRVGGQILTYVAFLCDCQTGLGLVDDDERAHEVAQLSRAVELLAKGEPFSIM